MLEYAIPDEGWGGSEGTSVSRECWRSAWRTPLSVILEFNHRFFTCISFRGQLGDRIAAVRGGKASE